MRSYARNGTGKTCDAAGKGRIDRGVMALILAVPVIAGSMMAAPDIHAAPGDRLSRGIELFRAGNLDAALVEFRAVVEARPHTPVAYYYAAHIRYARAQYPQARKNLLAALADSAEFHDASGLLACTDLKTGNTADAVIEWKRFTAAVGRLAPNEQVTAESIMLPEDYRARLSKVRVTAGVDSTASRVLAGSPRDTVTAGRSDTLGVRDGPAVTDLDRRIESQIRRGYYTIFGAAALLVLGAAGIFVWMRRRGKPTEARTFDSEVGRFAAGLPPSPDFPPPFEDEEPEPEDVPIDTRVRPYPSPMPAPPPAPVDAQEPPPTVSPRSVDAGSTGDVQRAPITEEMKALVARLHNEGRDIVDIARVADLTRTEVELIVAVRTRKTEQLVRAVAEEDETPDGGALHQAVRELAAEGRGVPEIARRLGVSTSEVKLALAVMERRKH